MQLVALRDQFFLIGITNRLCPCLKESNWRFVIGGCIRFAYLSANGFLHDSVWEYDCNSNYGCDKYNTAMGYLKPFRHIIQYVSGCIVDSINFLLQDSELDILRKEIKALREENKSNAQAIQSIISPSINLTDDDLIPDDPLHRALYDQAHAHSD